nr:MAG TPA: hypothetical protein [Caudoviricetes sp.]
MDFSAERPPFSRSSSHRPMISAPVIHRAWGKSSRLQ